jgi:hypothetical protein
MTSTNEFIRKRFMSLFNDKNKKNTSMSFEKSGMRIQTQGGKYKKIKSSSQLTKLLENRKVYTNKIKLKLKSKSESALNKMDKNNWRTILKKFDKKSDSMSNSELRKLSNSNTDEIAKQIENLNRKKI